MGLRPRSLISKTLLVVALLVSISFVHSSKVRADGSYLDNEVNYQGNIPNSLSLDAEDGITDEICHEYPQDPESATISCELAGDDLYSTAVNIGFPFQFYGHDVSDAYISSNGLIQFSCLSKDWRNSELPTTFSDDCDGTNAETRASAIFAFWDDVITSPKSVSCYFYDPMNPEQCANWTWVGNYPSVLYKTVGTPGSRKFIAQWTNMYLFEDPRIPLGTFQAILYEGSNDIQLQYRNLLGNPDRSAGSSATIGLQYDLENYSQYLYNNDELTEDSKTVHEGMAIRYQPDGEGGYAAANDQAEYDPVYLTDEALPGVPSLQSPTSDATNVLRRATYRWQSTPDTTSYTLTVSANANLSDAVINSTGLTTTQAAPTAILEANTQYYWLVRSINDAGESFSEIHSFTTGNRISLAGAVPNDGDANNDGIEDVGQTKVAGFVSPVNNRYVLVEVDDCPLQSASGQAEAANGNKDEQYDYDAGLVEFSANCGEPGYTATVKIFWYGISDSGQLLRKYNSTSHTYSSIDDATIEHSTIAGQPVVITTYQVVDGGSLDQDGVADGIIVDPVGLANVTTGSSPEPASTIAPELASTGQSIPTAIILGTVWMALGTSALLVKTRYFKR